MHEAEGTFTNQWHSFVAVAELSRGSKVKKWFNFNLTEAELMMQFEWTQLKGGLIVISSALVFQNEKWWAPELRGVALSRAGGLFAREAKGQMNFATNSIWFDFWRSAQSLTFVKWVALLKPTLDILFSSSSGGKNVPKRKMGWSCSGVTWLLRMLNRKAFL